jgi:hypothetical protein
MKISVYNFRINIIPKRLFSIVSFSYICGSNRIKNTAKIKIPKSSLVGFGGKWEF